MVNKDLNYQKLAAILFDLDDTLITDDSAGEKIWLMACEKFAPIIESHSALELYSVIHKNGDAYWKDPENHRRGRLDLITARRQVVRMSFIELGVDNIQIANDLADFYSFEKDKAISLQPKAIETLNDLMNRGLRLALITNGASDMQRRKINRFGLEKYFNFILIEGEFGDGKPDEKVFRKVLEKLKVDPAQAWMVGDDIERDIGGAQKCGIFSIWLDIKNSGLPQSASVQPDAIINNVSQLLVML